MVVSSSLLNPLVVTSSTHNYLCLILIIGILLVLLKEGFGMIRAYYSHEVIIKDIKQNNNNTVLNNNNTSSNIPEPIVVYMRDMGPVIRRTWNLFGEHFQELIGKCQYQERVRLDEIKLNAHLKLPHNDGYTEPYYRGGKLIVIVDINASELENWELSTIYGIKRSELKDVLDGSKYDIINVLTKPESITTYAHNKGCGPGPNAIEIVTDQTINLRECYPILMRLRSLTSEWVHICTFDARAAGGEAFDPRSPDRLYPGQELFVKSHATFDDGVKGVDKSVEISTKIMDRYGLEDQDPCLVCLEAERNTILLPCRHSPVCERCLLEIRKPQCPVCRANLDGYIIHIDDEDENDNDHL